MGNAFGHRRAHSQPAVLFLDIDGVLNSQASRRAGGDALEQGELPTFESQLPTAEMLALLAEIARAAPLRIAFVDVAVQPDTRTAVVESLRTVGLAPPATRRSSKRCAVATASTRFWRASSRKAAVVLLDDMDLLAMNMKLTDAIFVRTDDAVGLTRAKADEAIAKLHAQRDARR